MRSLSAAQAIPALHRCVRLSPSRSSGQERAPQLYACSMAAPPAVLGITENIPAGYQRVFGDLIVDNARGNGVESVLDLMTPQGYSATVEQAQRQKKIGADVIALSCTGMSSIQIAPALERETGLPVLDPVMCEGLMTLFELIRKDAQAK